ncbi:MAG: hypothetical protein VR71_18560 [Roseovarius sp. BRH_c41]|nr:MAG: hypothetical protein VR71_18560 [Roseovarius sp. BRH_c41]
MADDDLAPGGNAIAGSPAFCAYLFRSRAIGRVLLPVLNLAQAGCIDVDLTGCWAGGMMINIEHGGPQGLAERASDWGRISE